MIHLVLRALTRHPGILARSSLMWFSWLGGAKTSRMFPQNCPLLPFTASCRLPRLQKLPFIFWWEMSGPAFLWPIAQGIYQSGVLLWTIRQRGKITDAVFLTRAINRSGGEEPEITCMGTAPPRGAGSSELLSPFSVSFVQTLLGHNLTRLYADTLQVFRAGTEAKSSLCPLGTLATEGLLRGLDSSLT